jgi:lysophospholipase L1-like esterase
MSNNKIKKKNIIIFSIILPTFIALLAGEIYFRLFREYMTPEILKEKSLQYIPSLFSIAGFPEKKQKIEPHGYIKGYYINSEGYRGHDFPKKKIKGTIRIIIYGGSSVFDIFSPEGKDWPHQVEQMLKEKGLSNIEVINAGIPGLTSFDSMGRLFSDGWTLQPDYVVNYEAWNDICYFPNEKTIQKCYIPYNELEDPRISYQSSLDRLLCNFSQVYVHLRAKYYDWQYDIGLEGASKGDNYNCKINELGVKQYKLNLEMFVDLARNINATPILITQARLVDKGNSPEERASIAYKYARMNHQNLVKAFDITDEIIKEVSIEKHTHLIDASKQMSGKFLFFKDQVHTTDKGSYQLAKIVSEDLLDLISNRSN